MYYFLLFILISLLGLAFSINSNTLYLNSSCADLPSNGTLPSPFCNLSQALKHASSLDTLDPIIIQFEPGSIFLLSESLVIVNSVHLVGPAGILLKSEDSVVEGIVFLKMAAGKNLTFSGIDLIGAGELAPATLIKMDLLCVLRVENLMFLGSFQDFTLCASEDSMVTLLNITIRNTIFVRTSLATTQLSSQAYFENIIIMNSSYISASLVIGPFTNINIKQLLVKFSSFANSALLSCTNYGIIEATLTKIEDLWVEDSTFVMSFFLLFSENMDQLQNNPNIILKLSNIFLRHNDISDNLFVSANFYQAIQLNNLTFIENTIKAPCFKISLGESFSVKNLVSSYNNVKYRSQLESKEELEKLSCLIFQLASLSSVVLDSAVFDNNFATLGPIAVKVEEIDPADINSESNLVIFNSSFTMNEILYCGGDGNDGSGIFKTNSNTKMTLKGCVFLQNSVLISDAHLIYGNPCVLTLNEKSDLIIIQSQFTGNTAEVQSSCLSFRGDNIIIGNSYFSDNAILDTKNIYQNVKGALEVDAYLLSVSDCSFEYQNGLEGSVFFLHSMRSKNITITITSMVFKYNQASNSPFTLHSNLIIFNIILKNCSVSENSSNNLGGFLSSYIIGDKDPDTHSIFALNCSFSLNRARVSGGAFNIQSTRIMVVLRECEFIGNLVTHYITSSGAVFYISGENTAVLITEKCLFKKNNAKLDAGVLDILLGRYEDYGSKFEENSAAQASVLKLDTYSEVVLNGSLFWENQVALNGALQSLGRARMLVYGVLFERCRGQDSGAVISGFGLSQVTINKCIFRWNSASEGAVLFSLNLNRAIQIMDCIFEENISDLSLIYLVSASVNMTGNNFTSNNGRILYVFFTFLKITNLNLTDNICDSDLDGCSFNINSNSKAEISDLSIFNQISTSKYGAFYVKSSFLKITSGDVKNITSLDPCDFLCGENSEIYLYNLGIAEFKKRAVFAQISILILKNCSISQNSPDPSLNFSSGGVHCLDCVYLFFEGNFFTNMTAEKGGAIFVESNLVVNEDSRLAMLEKFGLELDDPAEYSIISYCEFRGCNSNQGGGIYVVNSNIVIKGSCFYYNQAKYQGGGVYLWAAPNTKNLIWIINKNNFTGNYAGLMGAGYYWVRFKPLEEEDNLFFSNSAVYGGENRSSEPCYLEKDYEQNLNLGNNLEAVLSGFVSGQILDVPIILTVRDAYGQRIEYLNRLRAYVEFSSTLEIYLNDTFYEKNLATNYRSVTGQEIVEIQKGKFVFDRLALTARPVSEHQLAVRTDAIVQSMKEYLPQTASHYINELGQYFYLIPIKFGECPLGYIYQPTKNTCEKCTKDKYSLSKLDIVCQKCPPNSYCNTNGSFIEVQEGYWRSGYFSTRIYECFLKSSCLKNSVCARGYYGPLCNTCVISDSLKFYKSTGEECQECHSMALSILILLIVILMVALYIIYSIKLYIKELNNPNKRSDFLSTNLKLIMDYIQITGAAANLPIQWPEELSNLIFFNLNISSFLNLFYPIDCLIPTKRLPFSLFFLKLYGLTLISVLLPMSALMFWNIYGKFKGKDKEYIQTRSSLSVMMICYIIQPSLLSAYFNSMNCFEIDGVPYLKGFMTEQCWHGDHMIILYTCTIPFLTIWMLILPALLFHLTRKYSKKKTSVSIQQRNIMKERLGFVKEGFDENRYYWEFVLLIRKYLMIMISVFTWRDIKSNVFIILLIMFVFIYMHVNSQPYKEQVMNNIALWANLSNYFTYCCILFFLINTNYSTKTFFAIAIVVGNIVFVLLWLFVIIKYKKNVLVEQLKKVSLNLRNSIFASKIVSLGSHIRESLSRQHSFSLVQAIRKRLRTGKNATMVPKDRRRSSLLRDVNVERIDDLRRRSVHSKTLTDHHSSMAFKKLNDEIDKERTLKQEVNSDGDDENSQEEIKQMERIIKKAKFRPKSHSTNTPKTTKTLKKPHQIILEEIQEDLEKNESDEWEEESSEEENDGKLRRKTVGKMISKGRTKNNNTLKENQDSHKKRLTKLSEIFKRESAKIDQRLSVFQTKDRFSVVSNQIEREKRKSVEFKSESLEAFVPRKRIVSDATEVEHEVKAKKPTDIADNQLFYPSPKKEKRKNSLEFVSELAEIDEEVKQD